MISTTRNINLDQGHMAAVEGVFPASNDSTSSTWRPDLPTDSSRNKSEPGVDGVLGRREPSGTPTELVPLDGAAMLALHEWLSRRRFGLFGGLRECDRQDAIEETFVQTLEFAPKMRDPEALRGACHTIGLRIRAKRIEQYIHERQGDRPYAEPVVSWDPERHLHERGRRKRAFAAIRGLPSQEREILQRFYFEGQSAEKIRDEMQLTETQFRLRKSRAIKKAGSRARPMTARAPLPQSTAANP